MAHFGILWVECQIALIYATFLCVLKMRKLKEFLHEQNLIFTKYVLKEKKGFFSILRLHNNCCLIFLVQTHIIVKTKICTQLSFPFWAFFPCKSIARIDNEFSYLNDCFWKTLFSPFRKTLTQPKNTKYVILFSFW